MRPSRPRPDAPQKPLVEVAILGDGDGILPPGETRRDRHPHGGEHQGLLAQPRSDRGAVHAPTIIVRTGDVGYLDEDGYLFIVDRKKEIIIRGGENISAAEVEAECYACPAVAEVSVFGAPDERLGEVPIAIVHREGRRAPARRATCALSSTASSQSSKSPSGSSSPISRCRASAPARSTARR